MSESTEFSKYLEEHCKAVSEFAADSNIEFIINLICDALGHGGTLYAFGNGGSAADASHFVGELMGRFENSTRQPYRAVCLNADMSLMTAIANDYDYRYIFTRQIMSLAKPGDIVIGFSTSGNSVNVTDAIRAANLQGALTIGFTGANKNNTLSEYATYCLIAPSERTCIIQEIHQLAMHYIAKEVEKALK